MCIEALHERTEVVDILSEKDPRFVGLRSARDTVFSKGRERA